MQTIGVVFAFLILAVVVVFVVFRLGATLGG
jgi:hypothetical protein